MSLDQRRLRDFPGTARGTDTRLWAAQAHVAFAPLLPWPTRLGLTSDNFKSKDGSTANIFHSFRIDPATLGSPLANICGIWHTARVSSEVASTNIAASAWPGFGSVLVPMDDGLMLHGKFAPPAEASAGDCVIVTHGLLGSLREEDLYLLADALRQLGHGVLALEMRGHGQTGRRSPNYPMTFGAMESRDLLAASRWARAAGPAQRIGLVTYSINGLAAVLAAWIDSRDPADDDQTSPLWRGLPKPGDQPAFDAGILILSPAINVIQLADAMQREQSPWREPVLAAFQQRAQARLTQFGAPRSKRMWDLVRFELNRSAWRNEYETEDAMLRDLRRFVNLTDSAGADRLSRIRSPLLVLQAANDPLRSAQPVAELFARCHNPNCGIIIIADGGHGGFASLSAPYFYSIMKGFFQAGTGPGTVGQLEVALAGGH